MKNYVIGLLGSLTVFLIGLTYLTIPFKITNIDVNNLFISATLIYSIIHFAYFLSNLNKPEEMLLSIAASLTGIFNFTFSKYLGGASLLSLSIVVLMMLILIVKLFLINHLKKKKDPYYCIEEIFTSIMVIVLLTIAFYIRENFYVEVLMLGFVYIIISVLDFLNIYLKNLLKSKKFLLKEMVR